MHPFLTAEHEAFRDTVRRFVRTEITPYAAEWDEAETFPRELYKKAAAIGMLGLGFPEEYGGSGGDVFFASYCRRNFLSAAREASVPA